MTPWTFDQQLDHLMKLCRELEQLTNTAGHDRELASAIMEEIANEAEELKEAYKRTFNDN